MKIETIEDIEGGLAPLRAVLESAIDPEAQARRLAQALEPYGPDGPWKYAPDSERARVTREVEDAAKTLAGESIYSIEQGAKLAEAWLAGAAAEAEEPLSPVEVWQRERRQVGALPPADVISLSTLAELQIARFDRNLSDAMPSRVLAAYSAALARPHSQESANLIRWVEFRHRGAWAGPGVEGDVTEAMAASALQQAITAARQARIPEDVKNARASIQRAFDVAARARRQNIRVQVPSKIQSSRSA